METTALNQKKLGFDNHFALDTNGFDFNMVNFIVSHLQPKSKFLTMPLKEAQSRSLSLEISLSIYSWIAQVVEHNISTR